MKVVRSLLFVLFALVLVTPNCQAQAHVTKEPVANDGTPVQVHLPLTLHMRNTGGSDGPRGPGSGSGLCVFTSINMAAHFQNVRSLQGFQKWMTHQPGGGWPEQVDKMINLFCREQGCKKPEYDQVVSNDLSILKLALNTGRYVSCTYGLSPTGRYNGQKVPHMVNLVAAGTGKGPDGRGWFCVQDNNYPGTYEWMSEAQFLRAGSAYGRIWSVILLAPSPPPPPAN